MGKIKTALEIALERANRLGDLSPEAAREARKNSLAPAAQALAKNCLEENLELPRGLEEALSGYDEEDKKIMVELLKSEFKNALTLDEYAPALKALEALDAALSPVLQSIEKVCQEYSREVKRAAETSRSKLAKEALEELARAGISGSAIMGFRLERTAAWEKLLSGLKTKWRSELDSLKAKL